MEFDGIILSHSRSSNVLVLTLVLGKYLQIDIFFTPEISLILSSERAFLERYEHDILRKHTNVFPRNTGGYEIQLYFKFSKLYRFRLEFFVIFNKDQVPGRNQRIIIDSFVQRELMNSDPDILVMPVT